MKSSGAPWLSGLYDLSTNGRAILPELGAGKRIMRHHDGIGFPGRRPIRDVALACRLRAGGGQKLRRRRVAEILGDRILFAVKDMAVVADQVAALGFGGRIDLMRRIGIDKPAVVVEIDRRDMQGLMQIAEEMGEQEQGLLFVGDRVGPRWRQVLQHRDGGGDGSDQVMRVGALEAAIEMVAFDGDIIEAVGVMAAALLAGRRIGALAPVAPDADSDELARVFRFDLAQDSEMISPTIPICCRPRARGVLAFEFLASGKPRGQLESRLGVLVFFCCFYCGRVGNALRVVQAQRHVHSATCSGLSAWFSRPPQALAGEIDAVGVVHQSVEDGGIRAIA